jgi:hypothetical protein
MRTGFHVRSQPDWQHFRRMRLSALLFSLPLVAFGPAAFAQNSPTANFDETIKFIDDHLSKVERNQKVGYRFTSPALCVAWWGNDEVRIEIPFGSLARIGVNTGSDASVICPAQKPGRGRPRAPGCIAAQHREDAGWVTHGADSFARFSVGTEEDATQVGRAFTHLIRMCGGGD